MNKVFLGALGVALWSGMAVAQDTDSLFPELRGQFEQAPVVEVEEEVDLTIEREEVGGKENPLNKKNDWRKRPLKDDLNKTKEKDEEEEDQKDEGRLIIQVQNVDGVLPYARTMAYCTAEAVLTNETNQLLNQLAIKATYKDMPKDLAFTNVSKKKKRTKKFMLIGLPCENIKGMPEIEITSCKLGKMSEEACKKKVQFLPPSG